MIIMYSYIIKISRGIEPLKKVLTVPRINHSAMIPNIIVFFRYVSKGRYCILSLFLLKIYCPIASAFLSFGKAYAQ